MTVSGPRYCSIESSNFPDTRIWSVKNISRSRAKTETIHSPRIMHMTFLGFVVKSGSPDLIYAVTTENKSKKIFNVCQVSAAILSSSRALFLSRILELLKILDPRKAEMCYTGA
jgi:hypothetical protein